MTTSPVLARNGNPGIVPAYLANPTAASAAPGATAPAGPALHIAPARLSAAGMVRSMGGAAAQAAQGAARSDKGFYIPIVIIGGEGVPGGFGGGEERLPRGGGWGGGFGEPEPQERRPSPQEKAATEGALKDIKGFWNKLGVGADEGNGPGPDVVYMADYPNASYNHGNGDELMEIGQDPDTGTSFGMSKDVIAHEYAHRVVRHILDLDPIGESGAVNESLADTFAAAVDTSNWTIGENSHPGGIRDMQHPEREAEVIHLPSGQDIRLPGNMKDYVRTRIDNGGVHINVGIPNKAAAYIGEHLGRDEMAKIYLGAIRKYMPQDGGIVDLANATLQSTTDQFGTGSKEEQAVLDAWKNVGISEEAGSAGGGRGGSRPDGRGGDRQPRDPWGGGGYGRW